MKKVLFASLILGGAVVLGCDKPADTAPSTPAAPSAGATMDKAMDQAKDVGKTAADHTAAAADATKATATDATKAAGTAAAGAMDEVNKALGGTPQEMIDKAMAFVKENKLTDAEGILAKLEAVKAKLPAEWASKVDSLKSAIETAKKGAAALPAVPGMGK